MPGRRTNPLCAYLVFGLGMRVGVLVHVRPKNVLKLGQGRPQRRLSSHLQH